MSESFVDGFCLKLQGTLPPEQIREVRDLLRVYSMGYEINPITTELIAQDYQLPQAYYSFKHLSPIPTKSRAQVTQKSPMRWLRLQVGMGAVAV